jgi:hypothetical protein
MKVDFNLGDTVRLLNDMHNIYIRAKKECNYNASRFLQMLSSNEEPVAIAKKLTFQVFHQTDSPNFGS